MLLATLLLLAGAVTETPATAGTAVAIATKSIKLFTCAGLLGR
jgi:hypothetical protein